MFVLQASYALMFPVGGGGLEILHLWSPTPMRNGSEEPAILDCDYDLDEKDKVSGEGWGGEIR